MRLIDVNVLVYAYRADAPDHERFRDWLENLRGGEEPYAVSDVVLSGFLRIVTHPKVFSPPSKIEAALQFAQALRESPNCIAATPGARHWSLFEKLCRDSHAMGNLVPDAYLAALAIESGSELVTADRGFGRFRGLRWRHPLESGTE